MLKQSGNRPSQSYVRTIYMGWIGRLDHMDEETRGDGFGFDDKEFREGMKGVGKND